jgi:hypothetical protein
MGKVSSGATGRGSPPDNSADLPPRTAGHKRPRSQLSNGGQQRSYPPSPPQAHSRPLSWPPLYLGAAGGGSGASGHGGAPLNLSESLYGYAGSPHQSNRFSQVSFWHLCDGNTCCIRIQKNKNCQKLI